MEAVFEQGVLRPLEPLSLAEHQRVLVTITDDAPKEVHKEVPYNFRIAELAWLRAHRHEYLGEWVAIEGDRLVSHGLNAVAVRDEAWRKGFEHPLFASIAKEDGPTWSGFL